MIRLLFGENVYESSKALSKFKSEYEKDVNTDIKIINADEISSLNELFASTFMPGLFTTKSVLIIKRLFQNKSKKLKEEAEASLSDDLDIIFWEDNSVDKRSKLYKTIFKKGKLFEYKKYTPAELSNMVKGIFKEYGIEVDHKIAPFLIQRVGENEMLLASEVRKLGIFAQSNKGNLSLKDIEKLIPVSREESVWEFIDALIGGAKPKALLTLEQLLKNVADYPIIFSLIVRQIDILDLLKNHEGMNLNDLATLAGVHPFVLKKNFDSAYKISTEKIGFLYDKLLGLDAKVKLGEIDPKLGLNLFVLSF